MKYFKNFQCELSLDKLESIAITGNMDGSV